MYTYQVESMRRTVKKILRRKKPPETVLIRLDQAKYICVDYIEDKNDIFQLREQFGEGVPKLVIVRVIDLAMALQKAKGVELNF